MSLYVMSEYYKSLISDEEVIKALIRESKLKNGQLSKENARIKPNLNFLQRTVSNNVSANNRISRKRDDFKKNITKETNGNQSVDLIISKNRNDNKLDYRKRKLAYPSDVLPVKFVNLSQPFKRLSCDTKTGTQPKITFVPPKDTDSDDTDSDGDPKIFVDSIECNAFVEKTMNNCKKRILKTSLKDSFSKISFVRSVSDFQCCTVDKSVSEYN